VAPPEPGVTGINGVGDAGIRCPGRDVRHRRPVAVGVLFGLGPAWQAARTPLTSTLAGESRTSTGSGRFRNVVPRAKSPPPCCFRALAHITGHRCEFVSRRRLVYRQFPTLADELAHCIRANSAIIVAATAARRARYGALEPPADRRGLRRSPRTAGAEMQFLACRELGLDDRGAERLQVYRCVRSPIRPLVVRTQDGCPRCSRKSSRDPQLRP